MSVTGQNFIEFADKCIAFGDEIGFRNAVGRSYYGVFHEICSKLEHCYVLTSHEGVRKYLMSEAQCKKEPYDKTALRKIGVLLHHLHVQRKWADYTLERDLTKADAESAMKSAKEAMKQIKTMHETVYPPSAA
ncbi:TPA: hypothetical protein PRR39_002043 [Escherichia coli]|jgi:uncharacterized protein (UPF0332 family)|uniref:hypothetical protein n=1 Tax=Escherichia coli TaxID=562 RepID=UPI000B3E664E|nr:hypothetical protein [Escherichia coli]EAC2092355.1 hypothetical protein [Escherichia coli]EEW1485191.1 hypothetical protein [Escherichia coli]EFE7997135.1 hypothetical protein [Escherichia coli]EFH3984155.1 hypothetical protein [Escherichia coli]EFH4259244.1 hypothetical protein [Escherichia coli]